MRGGVYVERRGKITLSEKRFIDNTHVVQVIRRIIAPLGRRIDESTPLVDARLKDGSRVNAIIGPADDATTEERATACSTGASASLPLSSSPTSTYDGPCCSLCASRPPPAA